MTVWVGLSGGIGSGKSQAAKLFADTHRVPVLDADAAARELTAPDGAALPALRRTLGGHFFDDRGYLKRPVLRQAAFTDPNIRQQLENILHPMIMHTLREQCRTAPPAPYGIIEIPLLAEQPRFRQLVSRILIIDCDDEQRIRRIHRRNGLDRQTVLAIMAAQAGRKQRLAIADDIIDNNGTPEQLADTVARLDRHYRQLFAQHRP